MHGGNQNQQEGMYIWFG